VKVAVVLESDLSQGGGFHQGLNAAHEVYRRAAGRFDVTVWTDVAGNVEPLRSLGMQARTFQRGPTDRLLALVELSQLGRRVAAKAAWLDSLERSLRGDGVDLAYFVTPSPSPARLKQTGFIATVWDLAHRDWPEFPEVHDCSEYLSRESIYSRCLTRAHAVVADSPELASLICRRYLVDTTRVLPLPFGPSPYVSALSPESAADVLSLYGLEPDYLFYPAQFWSHKNHVRIVQALAILRDEGLRASLVFSGADKGNQAHVRATVARLGLDEQVRFLGLVPSAHLRPLYIHSAGLVMPTYFGPTNLPPLEAWSLGKPVIYSRHLAAQAGGAAILVDPDDEHSIAAAIRSVLEGTDGHDWKALGLERLQHLTDDRTAAVDRLMEHFNDYERRRRCWA
jgi:glycosyltransferase involved in cell wall biosynthesis